MKGIVAYDSVHGNTKQVAEAMAEQIRAGGHQVELVSVKDVNAGSVAGDFMLIGSPTRGGKMTKETEAFVEGLDVASWKGKPIAVFDTVGPLSKDADKRRKALEGMSGWSKNAASKLRDSLQARGLGCSRVMHFAVVGFWGPLAPDATDMARDEAKRFLSSL